VEQKETKVTKGTPAGSALADALVRRIGSSVGDKAKTSTVFGDPVERNGVTVIPVARAWFGFGGGGGVGFDAPEDGSGGGGGGGAFVSAIGYIEVRDGAARFKRIYRPLDVLVVLAGAAMMAVTLTRLASELVRVRSHQ
jgi:uncharacterized spore protein YtfJ